MTATPAIDGTGHPVQRSTGPFGVIVFLASDLMLFGAFFAAYFLLRSTNEPWPPADVHLETVRSAVFTVVLVTSSFTMIAVDRAQERGDSRGMRRWLIVTIALGAGFLGNQLLEYTTLDFSADSHPYGSIYWGLTGLHALHVTAGLTLLALLFVRAARARAVVEVAPWTTGVSLFWHLVDVVWVAVFVTIWVIR
jgi:cytochrome c oxidase subunit 3